MPRKTVKLLDGVTTTTVGEDVLVDETARTYQATISGTGAVTGTILIEGSNDDSASLWVLLGTITLSGTTTDTDGFGSVLPWLKVRARLTAITGTSAAVNVIVGS